MFVSRTKFQKSWAGKRAQKFNQAKDRYLHIWNDSDKGNNISKEKKMEQKEKRTEERMRSAHIQG